MPNKLIAVGFLGLWRVYVNVGREEAIRRYCESEGYTELDPDLHVVKEVEFKDEFGAYDVWDAC